MRVTYVLPHPELGGGNKVAAQHAAMLAGAGFDVTMIADGPRPAWLPFAGRYVDTTADRLPNVSQDVIVATFWSTIETAENMGLGPVAHFCQGYEGGLVHLRAMLPQIEAVYSTPRPTLTVTPALGEFVQR